jgi:hypothetical protein
LTLETFIIFVHTDYTVEVYQLNYMDYNLMRTGKGFTKISSTSFGGAPGLFECKSLLKLKDLEFMFFCNVGQAVVGY